MLQLKHVTASSSCLMMIHKQRPITERQPHDLIDGNAFSGFGRTRRICCGLEPIVGIEKENISIRCPSGQPLHP